MVRLGAGGHIQQLQRLGSVERDQTGQRASVGQDLDQGADVAGWVLVSHCTVTRKPGQRPAAGPSGSGAGRKFALSYRNQREQVTSLRPPDNRHY